jgi:hypothetical protein
MMAGLFGLETPKVMNVEDCSEIRHNTRRIGNIVVMQERTTGRKSHGFTRCLRFQNSGCRRISLCWTVIFIVVMVFMWYPASTFGMQAPGSLGAGQRGQRRENSGRQKRAIIDDNVVSIQSTAFES